MLQLATTYNISLLAAVNSELLITEAKISAVINYEMALTLENIVTLHERLIPFLPDSLKTIDIKEQHFYVINRATSSDYVKVIPAYIIDEQLTEVVDKISFNLKITVDNPDKKAQVLKILSDYGVSFSDM